MIYNVKISNNNREHIIEFINEKRKFGKFTVVDVGGSVEGWSAPIVDAIVDFNDPVSNNKNIINKSTVYERLMYKQPFFLIDIYKDISNRRSTSRSHCNAKYLTIKHIIKSEKIKVKKDEE